MCFCVSSDYQAYHGVVSDNKRNLKDWLNICLASSVVIANCCFSSRMKVKMNLMPVLSDTKEKFLRILTDLVCHDLAFVSWCKYDSVWVCCGSDGNDDSMT